MNIKNNRIGEKIKKLLGLCLLVCIICLSYNGGAAKAEASGWKMPEKFEEIKGDGKYIQEQYFYYLDMEKVGLLDNFLSIFNGIANMLFSLEVMLARAAVYLFYYCMTFDTSMFSEQITAIQGVLHTSLFQPFFQVALVLLTTKLISRLFRRNFIGIFSECAYTIIILVAATFVVYHSSPLLDGATAIAKQISIESMLGMNGTTGVLGATTEEYAAHASGLLWKNIVHDPWRELEFGGANTALEAKLMSERDFEKRQEAVSGKSELIPTLKSSNVFMRCAMVLFYFVPIVIKGVIYAALAIAQLFFQIMATFFVLLAPLILVVSLFPGYGTTIIETWLRKLMEFEIGIIITTMLIAFMVYLDNVMLGLSGEYGIIMSFLLQIAIALSLFFGRSHIFSMFQKLQKTIQSPAYGNAKLRNLATTNPVQIKQVEKKAVETVRKAPKKVIATGGKVRNAWQNYDEKMKDMDVMTQVAQNNGTAKGLTVDVQERAYDLYRATEKRKREQARQERIAREREEKAEYKKTAHRVRAVNYWNGPEDARLVDIHTARPKTKVAREAEKKGQVVENSNVVRFRDKASETSNPNIISSGMHGVTQTQASGTQAQSKKQQESHEIPKKHQHVNRGKERTINSVSLPSPGIQLREHVKQGQRKPRPAAWKQMNINREKGVANDRTGVRTTGTKNTAKDTAGNQRSNADAKSGNRRAGR